MLIRGSFPTYGCWQIPDPTSPWSTYSPEASARWPTPGIVVVAGHRQAVNQLHTELRQAAPGLDVRLAGDAHAPRNFDAATAEGALVGAGID